MHWNLENLISQFKDQNQGPLMRQGLYGLEKEMLRSDLEGNLAQTPHPASLGDKLKNPHITTDFSESQIELITPALPSLEETHDSLKKLHHTTAQSLNNEWLWPLSMPCKLPDKQEDIPIARYDDSEEGQKNEIYRKGLSLRYGRYMQTISGVHYNRSFSKDFWEKMHTFLGSKQDLKSFVNEGYLHLVRNFIRYRWLLVLFSGASPNKDASYGCKAMPTKHNQALSLRLSRCGYSNPAKIKVDYNHFKQYLNDLKTAVSTRHAPYTELNEKYKGEKVQLNDHLLQIGNEYYFPIRLKPPKPNNDMVEALAEHGVEYIEVRLFDLNPFQPTGVSLENLYFSDLFLMFCLLKSSPELGEKELAEGTENQEQVAMQGQDFSALLKENGKEISLKEGAQKLLTGMADLANLMDEGTPHKPYNQALKKANEALQNPALLPAFQVLKEVEESKKSFIEYGLEKAKEYTEFFKKTS